jgi:hypothetical protein
MPGRLWALLSACLNKDPGARPTAVVLAGALRDPVLPSELALPGAAAPSHGTPPYGSPFGGPSAPDGSTSSGAVTNLPGYGAHVGPVTASVRLPAMAPSAVPAAAAAALAMLSPETEVPWRGASPETEAAVVGFGAAGLPPGPGRRARHREARHLKIRPAWAVAAAAVLVVAGVAGTYLTVSGGTAGKAAGPLASPLVASSKSRAAALVGTAKPVASHRVATPSAQPSAPAANTAPAPAVTSGSAATPAGKPSPAAPAGTPGPTGPELVTDGDFTDSTLSAWNIEAGNPAVVSGGSRGGYAAQLTADPTAGISQVITGLKPGTEYELTGWIISDTGNFSTYVGVKDYDDTTGVSRALNETTWTEAELTFTPAPGHTTAEVFCWQSVQGTGFCTDMSVRAMS